MTYLHCVSPKTQLYTLTKPFSLELGKELPHVQVAYRTWGELNSRGDNAVLVCHALTGHADVDDWWAPLLGSGRALDPSKDFIVCSNILGSCYGTTGPTSVNPETGYPYGPRFPVITVRDMVKVQAQLLEGLGVQSLRLVIGGSLGGMQALEWGVQYGDRVQNLVIIAAPGRHSPWCIGLSETQRQAIYADPHWQGGHYAPEQPPNQGLAVARMIAMVTYRSWHNFQSRFGRSLAQDSLSGFLETDHIPAILSSFSSCPYAISQYLHRHGDKLVARFDANTYITLTHAMDSHDVGAHFSGENLELRYQAALKSISPSTLVIAIDTDILYPPIEQQELVNWIPQAQFSLLNSLHGHDAFLIDMEILNQKVLAFRQQKILNF